jgi:hypothetical protein
VKILVLTVESGENEFSECLSSVQRAADSCEYSLECKHISFSGLSRHEADSTVYKTIMDRVNDYDFFIKLDADMKVSKDFFTLLCEYLLSNAEVAHLIIPVRDFLSGKEIIGLHIFSKFVRWEGLGEKDAVFVDPGPLLLRGKKKTEYSLFRDKVHHCFNPSEQQAFYYGMHRGLKFYFGGGGIRAKTMAYSGQYFLAYQIRKKYMQAHHVLRGFFLRGFLKASSLSRDCLLGGLEKKTYFDSFEVDEREFKKFLESKTLWFWKAQIMYCAFFLVLLNKMRKKIGV